MQLVLDTKGLKLSKKGGIFLIEKEEKSRSISPVKLSSIAVTANVELTTEAVMLAVSHQLPIFFFDRTGRARARLWSPYFSSISTLRRSQVYFRETTEATAWMVNLFEWKAEGQIDNLKYLRKQKSGLGAALSAALTSLRSNTRQLDNYRDLLIDQAQNPIMGVEGAMARVYWQAVGQSLPRGFRFNGRSRRPAKDIFNAALNYGYGMLYSVVESGLFDAGLDPHLGFLHADEYDKPTLAFDLIEPFRPWVDRLLIQACFDKALEKQHFTSNQYGIFLNKTGKTFFIPHFNDFLRSKRTFLGQEATVKNHIYFLASSLAQRIRSSAGGTIAR